VTEGVSRFVSSSLLFAALFAGCLSTLPVPTTQPSAVAPTMQPSAVASASPSAPPTLPRSAWGPLAVIPPQGGGDTVRNQGTLLITDACVYLVWRGNRTFLFWPANRTRWNEETRAITYSNLDGTVVTVANRDDIVIGGGGSSTAHSGVSGREWASRMDWVAPPDPSCSAEVRFGVGEVEG
jgi:hypothetical protein